MARPVTDRREEILQFIIRFKREHDGLAPTMREIAAGMGIASTSTVKYHLDQLAADGRIRVLKGNKNRGVMVIGGQWRHNG